MQGIFQFHTRTVKSRIPVQGICGIGNLNLYNHHSLSRAFPVPLEMHGIVRILDIFSACGNGRRITDFPSAELHLFFVDIGTEGKEVIEDSFFNEVRIHYGTLTHTDGNICLI